MLTIQQAAYKVLELAKEPLKSTEIANRILAQGLLESSSKNPVQSISQALERNIRMNKGNLPKLKFIETSYGRMVTREEVLAKADLLYEQLAKPQLIEEKVLVTLPKDLLDKVKIFQLTTGAESLDEAFMKIIRSGLSNYSEEMIESLKKNMENL